MGEQLEEKRWQQRNTELCTWEVSLASQKLLLSVASFLRKCYLRAIPAERFVDFWCAVCSKGTGDDGQVYPPIIDRPEMVKNKYPSDGVWAQGRLEQIGLSRLKRMGNEEFSHLLREVLPAVPDEDLRRHLIGLSDLAGLFKMNTVLPSKGGLDFYEMLCERFPQLTTMVREDWKKLNDQSIWLRNRWIGHSNEQTFLDEGGDECITAGEWRETSAVWLKVAEPLRIEETEPYYQEILKVCQSAENRMNWKLVSLQTLAEESGCYTAEEVRKILSENYRYDCSDDALFCDKAEAMSCLSAYARMQSMQQELNRRNEELKKIKASMPATAEEILRKYLQKKESGKLELLLSYAGGNLDRRTIQELVQTHKIVLDPSLLKRREGRQFVMDELRPALERCGHTLQSSLIVEATALYHLQKGYMEFQFLGKKRRTMVRTAANCQEYDQLTARCEELKSTKAAYLFARDELRLVPTGIPDPTLTDEQALAVFLRDHPLQRFCVLTCGATGVVKHIRRDRTPFVCVGRVRSAGDAAVCSIFSQFLPFEKAEDKADALEETLAEIKESALPEEPESGKPGEAEPKQTEPEPEQSKPEPKQTELEPEQSEREPELSAPAEKAEEPENLPQTIPAAVQQTAGEDRAVRHASEVFAPDLPLKTMDETLLPLTVQPRTGDSLLTEDGESVLLAAPLMEGGEEARGGEGAVYETSIPGQVAKIYFADHLTAGRRDKLTEMLRHDPGLEGLCWPTHLLYNGQGEFVGYTMLRAPKNAMPFSKSVLKIGSPSQRKAYMKEWTRSDLVRAARGAARLLAGLHSRNILMGDVNAGNFMVDLQDSSRVYAVDTDSFQLGGYPCPVGFEDFTHPGTAARLGVKGALRFGTFLRTQEEEEYALAILLFEILFLGVNPFVTKSEMTYLEAMRKRSFPYANTGDEWTVPDGDNWMIWKNLPRKITDAFTATFAQWKTTSAEDWRKMLDEYLYSIEHYNFSNELAPVKYHEFHPEDPVYVDVKCAYCGKEFNLHKIRYASLVKSKQPLFCRDCTNFRTLHKDEPYPETMKCSKCGAQFKTTIGEAFCVEAGVEPALCFNCRNPETQCAGCGQKFRMPYNQLESLQAKKVPITCKNCRGSEEVTCQSCGKTYEEKTWKVRRNRRIGREMYCDECREQIQVKCELCGKTYKTARWRDLKNKKDNWPGLCDECRRLEYVTVPCDSCGDETTVSLNVFRRCRHNNQPIRCHACYRNSFR